MAQLVFEFSGPISIGVTTKYMVDKIVKLVGGTKAFVEDGNKLVIE